MSASIGKPNRDPGRIQPVEHRLQLVLPGPLLDGRVQKSGFFGPAIIVGEARVVADVVSAHHVHQAFEDAVAVAADQHVSAIAAEICIGGRNSRQGAAARLTHITEVIVFGNQALHHSKNRFVQSDVDALAPAAVLIAMMQSQQNADNRIQRRNRVADADASAHRRPPGSPVK